MVTRLPRIEGEFVITKKLTAVLIGIICLWSCVVRADDVDKYIASVQATNGLALGISIIDRKLGTNTTEQPVDLVFKAPPNATSELFMLKDEYVARIELYDDNNRLVAKTQLGSKLGRNFDEVSWDIKKFASHPHGPIHPKDAWAWGKSLPRISELFALERPGIYYLKVEAQVMVEYLDMTKKQTRQIVRFPPVEITVKCPERKSLVH